MHPLKKVTVKTSWEKISSLLVLSPFNTVQFIKYQQRTIDRANRQYSSTANQSMKKTEKTELPKGNLKKRHQRYMWNKHRHPHLSMKLKQQEQLRRFITILQPPNKDHIALKLNRLKDKRIRHEPHKDFRSQ